MKYIYISTNEVKHKTNLGNKYKQQSFTFIIKNTSKKDKYDSTPVGLFAGIFSAKNLDNALKNATKYCRINNCEFICRVESDRTIQSYGANNVIRCVL